MAWSSESGLALACLSAVFNGSFISLSKIPSVAAANVSPALFNLYICVGVFLSSWLVLPAFRSVEADLSFTPYGAVAGVLFVLAILGSLVAVDNIGVSMGQGVWGAAAILVSFSWGTFAPEPLGKPLGSAALSALSVLLLLLGVLGIVFCAPLGCRLQSLVRAVLLGSHRERLVDELPEIEQGAERRVQTEAEGMGSAVGPDHGRAQLGAVGTDERSDGDECERLGAPLFRPALDSLRAGGISAPSLPTRSVPAASGRGRVMGLLAALTVGLSGGSILVPLSYTPSNFHGERSIAFMPSFGIGALLGGCLATGCWYFSQEQPPPLQLRSTFWAGLVSGILWNTGNLCSILAIEFAHVPFGVAYPILQSSLVVAGLIGIFVFREITAPGAILVFFLSAFVVLGGAVMLSVYGPQAS